MPLKALKLFDIVVLRFLGVMACGAGIFLIGYIDVISDYRIDYSVFYFMPICFASLFLRKSIGAIMALTATGVYWFANKYASQELYLYWNVFLHGISFLIIGIAFARLKEDYDRIQALRRRLFRAQHRF
jgi:hypothetical protein